MKTLELKRVARLPHSTLGILFHNKIPFALSLEKAWKNNETNVSCIPAGDYLCERINSPKFGNTFEVMEVKRRTHILFHTGNTHENTHGCILVGEEFGKLGDDYAVLSSKRGFAEFMYILKESEAFWLSISWSC